MEVWLFTQLFRYFILSARNAGFLVPHKFRSWAYTRSGNLTVRADLIPNGIVFLHSGPTNAWPTRQPRKFDGTKKVRKKNEGTKKVRKRYEIDLMLEMVRKWYENGTKMVRKVPKRYEKGTKKVRTGMIVYKMVRKWYENGTKMVRKLLI
jgi:hypothetical protein